MPNKEMAKKSRGCYKKARPKAIQTSKWRRRSQGRGLWKEIEKGKPNDNREDIKM